jgi:hypothetical protein
LSRKRQKPDLNDLSGTARQLEKPEDREVDLRVLNNSDTRFCLQSSQGGGTNLLLE